MPLPLDELFDLLRIESISSDGAHPAEMRAAADWVAGLAGDGRVVEGFGNPLVDALIPASVTDAPTVVAYGHYDVQAPGDQALWTSPAFAPLASRKSMHRWRSIASPSFDQQMGRRRVTTITKI